MLPILGGAHFLLPIVPLPAPSGEQLNRRLPPTATSLGAGQPGQSHGGAFPALCPRSPSLETGPSAGQLRPPWLMGLPTGWLHNNAIPAPRHVFKIKSKESGG